MKLSSQEPFPPPTEEEKEKGFKEDEEERFPNRAIKVTETS